MRSLYLDCETFAQHHLVEMFRAHAVERGDDPVRFVATSTLLAQVVAIGVGNGIDDVTVYCGRNESDILWSFAETLEAMRPQRIVTFAGRGFDLPLLINRMRACGVQVPGPLMAAANEPRYRQAMNCDLQEQLTLCGATFRRPSLREACVAFGIGDPKESCSGNDVQRLVEANDWGTVLEYCRSDVEHTILLDHAVNPVRQASEAECGGAR